MAKAPIPKTIIRLAIPTVISSVVSIFYNLTDTFFIGMLDDPIQLGAISLAFPVFLVISAISTVFSVGASTYVSNRLGAEEYDKARRACAFSFYVLTAIMLVLTVLYFIFQDSIVRMMGATEENIVATKEYLRVIMSFGAAIAIQIVLPTMLRAEGKAVEAGLGAIIGTIFNIILDPILILQFDMGVRGAAWATNTSNIIAAVYCIVAIKKKKGFISLAVSDCRPDRGMLGSILKIGCPAAAAQLVMSLASILLNNFASAYGNNAISALGVSNKLLSIMVSVIGGYVTGYLPFAAYNYGAHNMERLRKAFLFIITTSTILCIAIMVPFRFFGSAFMRAFTNDKEIITLGTQCLYVYVFCFPVLGIEFAVLTTFQAVGQAMKAMLANLSRQGIFYIPALILFRKIWGFAGLVYAQVAADYITAFFCLLLCIPFLRWVMEEEKGR